MKLKLPNVTLLGIDCVNPKRTLTAMLYSMRLVDFGAARFVANMSKLTILREKQFRGIDMVHHVQGDRFDYEFDVVKRTKEWFVTDFVLYQEWDSMVINPGAWSDNFMGYDFIGAPWPYPHTDPIGFPSIHAGNAVGNGGFCLKSKRFCETVSGLANRRESRIRIHDAWQSRVIRPELEQAGIKFAPYSIAERFSCENRLYSGEFGAHGKTTGRINGWDLDFSWLL